MRTSKRTSKATRHIHVRIRYRNNRSGTITPYLDIYHNGSRRYVMLTEYKLTGDPELDTTARSIVEAIAADYEVKIRQETVFGQNHKRPLFTIIDTYDRTHLSRAYNAAVHHFRAFLTGQNKLHILPSDASHILWEQFYWWMQSNNLVAHTAYRYLGYIYALMHKAIPDFAFKTWTPRNKPIAKPRIFLTETELLQLFQVLQTPEFFKAKSSRQTTLKAFLFGCLTGLRVGDIRRLQWLHIVDNQIILNTKKTKKIVRIPITSDALHVLPTRTSNDPSAPIWPHLPRFNKYTQSDLRYWFKQANISKPVHFHISRHTFATRLIAHNTNIFVVRDLLAHTNLQTTQLYVHLVDQQAHAALHSLPTLNSTLTPQKNGLENHVRVSPDRS